MTNGQAPLRWAPLLWTGLWMLLLAVAVTTRPPLPVDETRYLAVAWEMWLRGDFLVPHLNGETYSHKPPLLFWLMQAGWGLFGVDDIWPRLVAPLFGLGSLFLTASLAKRLWPDRPEIAATSPLILLGSLFWALFTTLTMFDMLLALCTLISLIGTLDAWKKGGTGPWVWVAIGIGVGVLAKGPAILLHTLPVPLLAPLWAPALCAARPDGGGWKRWYLSLLMAVLGGAAIGLAWAIPAAIEGGAEYRNAIFWGQTAGRVVQAFDHARPWWWYLAVIGPMLLPWVIWPPLWRAFKGLRTAGRDGGLRFCLIWFLPAFIIFSIVSGKQLHYLLPDFAAFAMILARLLPTGEESALRPRDGWLPGGFILVLCGGLAIAAVVCRVADLQPDLAQANPLWLVAPALNGFAVLRGAADDAARAVAVIATMMVISVGAVHLAGQSAMHDALDLRPLSEKLGEWDAEGRPLAFYGEYHGQFHFLGRLTKPMDITGDQEVADWIAAHPTGKIVTVQSNIPERATPDFVTRFRNRNISVWDAGVVGDDIRLVFRDP